MEFSYDSVELLKNEIRIFVLLPGSETEPEEKEEVRLELMKAGLEKLPHVNALSYHWGHPNSELQKKRDILVNGRRLSITGSLEAALRALRKFYGGRLFWADQICINQGNREEKLSQIPYMSQIFSMSAQTIGWLGKDIDISSSAATRTLESLEELGRKALEFGIPQADPDRFRQLHNNADEDDNGDDGPDVAGAESVRLRRELRQFITRNGDMLDLPGFDGILRLCEAEYFVRGWIREEIALPKKLLLRWVDGAIDGETFSAAVLFLDIYSHHWVSSMRREDEEDVGMTQHHQRLSWVIHDPVQPSVAVRQRYQNANYRTGRFFNLAHILRHFRHLEFTNPEDRVIGVHALVNDMEALGLTIEQFKSKSWIDVFTLTAKAIIQKPINDDDDDDLLGGVNFMSLCGLPRLPRLLAPSSSDNDDDHPEPTPTPENALGSSHDSDNNNNNNNNNQLPSWVPNLDESQRAYRTPMTLAEETNTCSCQPFNASRGHHHPITKEEQASSPKDVLLCKAIIVDKILAVDKVTRDDNSYSGGEMLKSIRDFAARSAQIAVEADSVHPYRGQKQKLLDATWRVPILDHEFESTPTAQRRATTAFSGAGWIAIAQNKQGNEKKKNNYKENFLRPLQKRRSFLSEKGFVGVGPESLREGDWICVIHGGCFPFILRERPDRDRAESTYAMVGQAYCYGIMDGEAFQMGIVSQTIQLV